MKDKLKLQIDSLINDNVYRLKHPKNSTFDDLFNTIKNQNKIDYSDDGFCYDKKLDIVFIDCNDTNDIISIIHEFAHFTSHKSRLNRNITGNFFSLKYAMEEIKAELSGILLGHLYGKQYDKYNLEYIKSWLKLFSSDTIPDVAVKDSIKIVKFLLEY